MLATAASRGIYDILDSTPEVTDPADGGRRPPLSLLPEETPSAVRRAPSAEVAFDRVSFAYPGRGKALDDLSFELRAGERLGLVGPSGAGKSTIVWLLLRFFDPQEGRILLGGRDLRELPLDIVRGHFAVVTQDTYLFHGT